MSTNKARNPFTIFRESIKRGINEEDDYVLNRAVVYEVDTKGGMFNDGTSPINSIKCKIYKPQIDMNDSGYTILWPWDDYDLKPIAPYEHVFAIYEKSSNDYGFWICRCPNKDKSYISADEDIIQESNRSAAETFGVEGQECDTTINDLVLSNEDLQEKINNLRVELKRTINFEKRIQDHVLASKNTSRIVIGSDRRDSVDSGYKDGEAIDIVVGVQKEDGDPDFDDDKSRTYISSKSSAIDGLNNQDEEALWYVKSDNDALIARKDILIESKDGRSKIKFNRDGSINIEGNQKVTVKAPEIVCDSPKTTIGGTAGKKILTTIGPDIPSILVQAASYLNAISDLAIVAPLSATAIQNAAAQLQLAANSMAITINSDAN